MLLFCTPLQRVRVLRLRVLLRDATLGDTVRMGAGGEEEGIELPVEGPAKVATAKRQKIVERPRRLDDDDDGWSAATTARKRPDNGRSAGQSESTTV